MVAILGYSREQIRAAIQQMYTAVAERPDSDFHFPVGVDACRALGYTGDQLRALPEGLPASFAGVGNPFLADAVRPGDTVLDLGAGTGVDTFIAAEQAGPGGAVLALDLTAAMTRKLHGWARRAGRGNIRVIQASAEALPLADHSIDCITSNGALNLVPDKRRAVAEMFRVLRPGGRVQIADVVIGRPVMVDCDSDPRLWVECVVGAMVREELLELFRDAGFGDVAVVREHDYFAHSPSKQTREVARGFRARAVEVFLRRGPDTAAHRGRLRRWHPARQLSALRRRGLLGVTGLGLALFACYGLLAATVLLGLAGIGFAPPPGLWSSAIAAFTVAAVGALIPGARRHRAAAPLTLAAAGAALVLLALFVHYHAAMEAAGFALLALGVWRDHKSRRQHQARLLGL